MKKYSFIFVLMILPIILVMLSIFFRASKGDFFLIWQYDPSYVYLLNSLNLSQLNGYGTGFVQHPGITVQIVGALIIKAFHTFQGENPDVVIDVFTRPEFYLWRINLIFNIMVGLALFVLGFVTYKKLGSIYAALLLQASPFFFSVTYLILADVNSEIFLVFTVLLFIAVSISFVKRENFSKKNSVKYVIIYALICGFGLATKLTFFPILIIPIILIRGFFLKGLFLAFTLISFLIFVFPALSSDNINYFFYWVKSLTTRSGIYGTGSENIVEGSIFIQNLKSILTSEFIFSFTYLVIICVLILQFFPRFKKQIRTSKYYKLLIGIFIFLTVQILLVSKHFSLRYFITGFTLSLLALLVINFIFSDLIPKYFKRGKFIYLSLILFCSSVIQLDIIVKEIKFNIKKRNESYRFINYLENYKQEPVVNSYGSSSKEFGLQLGVAFSGSRKKTYRSILRNLFPNYIHYNKFTEDFVPEEISYVKKKLINTNKLFFQCDNKEIINNFMNRLKQTVNKPNATYKLLYFSHFTGEAVYEITLEPN